MAIVFTLFYRRGSFAQSEIFGSLPGAMSGAYARFALEGCSAFSIEADGATVMHHAQIQEQYQAARAALLRGERAGPAKAAE